MNPSELTLVVLQIAFLFILWVFVFAILYSLRSDLFGQRVRRIQPEPVASASPRDVFVASALSAETAPVAAAANEPPIVFSPIEDAPHSAGEVASPRNTTRLVITNGAKAGVEFPLGDEEITIGRSSDSAIIIRDDYTSTHHARIMLRNGQWMVQDLNSTNGTFLGTVRLTEPTPIPIGVALKVGATTFELRG